MKVAFQDLVADYFNRFADDEFSTDIDLVKEASSKIEFSYFSDVIVTVPVYIEDNKIEMYLRGIERQFSNTVFNVFFLVNYNSSDGIGEDKAALLNHIHTSAVMEFNLKMKRKCASLALIEICGKRSMGRVRRIQLGAILKYCVFANLEDAIIICNDIDQIACGANYVKSIVSLFETENPVFIAGHIGYGYNGCVRFNMPFHIPELFLFNRVQYLLNKCAREGTIGGQPTIWPEGANMAFKASIYCAIGGFEETITSGEDDEIGFRFTSYYKSKQIRTRNKLGAPMFTDEGWIITDPRRILKTILNGRTGIEAWSWEPFFNSYSAALDTDRLYEEYRANNALIQDTQVCDIESKENLLDVIRRRVSWIFFRSIIFDHRTKNLEELKVISTEFGLPITHGRFDRNIPCFEAEIDWGRASIISELREAVTQYKEQ